MTRSSSSPASLPVAEAHAEWRIAQAFSAARIAQAAWASRSIGERLAVLRDFRDRLALHGRELAATVHRPEAETLTAQVIPLAEACRFLERDAPAALRVRRLGRRGRPAWLMGVSCEIHREPAGVVLILAPSNYPIFIPGTQMLQALAAGNAAVVKPSEGGVAAALLLRDLLVEAGLDSRLLPILPPDDASAVVAVRERPDHILLTGSSETGRVVLQAAARHWIPCTLELSGSDAVFVRADADLDRVARALAFSLRLNGGATCIAPRRVFADRRVLPELEARLVRELSPLPPEPIEPRQRAKLVPLLHAARIRGARILVGNENLGDPVLTGPLVVTQARPSMPLLQTDLFAPVLSLVGVRDDEDALEQAAQCPWALGASVFSRDLAAARRIAGRVNAGSVTVNDLIVPTADPRLPFGGRAASGYGVTRGREGLLTLTRTKTVAVRTNSWLPHLVPPQPEDADLFAAALSLSHARRALDRLGAVRNLIRLALRRSRPPTRRAAANAPSIHSL